MLKVFRLLHKLSDYYSFWSKLLLISVICFVFLVGFLPEAWMRSSYRYLFIIIYLSATFTLSQYRYYLFVIAFSAILMGFLFDFLGFYVLGLVSSLASIMFFFIIVVMYISQISRAKRTDYVVIMESISGYFLLGIMGTMLLMLVVSIDPKAFNFSYDPINSIQKGELLNQMNYFSFVSLSTLGYGDLLAIKPYTRSLAIFISVSGQLYIAIIIALLVGKKSSQAE